MTALFPPVPFAREAKRRADVIAKGCNGIDFIDVAEDRRTLSVYFFLAAPRETGHRHYRITGGTRVRNLRIARQGETSNNAYQYGCSPEGGLQRPTTGTTA